MEIWPAAGGKPGTPIGRAESRKKIYGEMSTTQPLYTVNPFQPATLPRNSLRATNLALQFLIVPSAVLIPVILDEWHEPKVQETVLLPLCNYHEL